MSKEEEHDRRLGIIVQSDTMLHDYNLISVMFPALDPFVVSARILEVYRMNVRTLRSTHE